MAVRSVTELLPRDFDDLDLADVRTIVGLEGGEVAETVFLECKSEVRPAHLAKAAAAFANTMGGLLVGGVDNDSRAFVGLEPPAGEIELWVKDILRTRVLPLPPFRARTLAIASQPDRAILLVLVPASSTTPHLLTERGAIYIRNPSSSDPSPVRDQLALLDLIRRGESARNDAWQAVGGIVDGPVPGDGRLIYGLSLAPTGWQGDPVRRLYRANTEPLVRPAIEIFEAQVGDAQMEPATWEMNKLSYHRVIGGFMFNPPFVIDAVEVHAHGVIRLSRGWRGRWAQGGFEEPEPRGPQPLHIDDESDAIVPWLSTALTRGRELVLTLGGHGDLAVAVHVATADRNVFWEPQHAIQQVPGPFRTQHWSRLDDDTTVIDQIRSDLRRFLGLAPE